MWKLLGSISEKHLSLFISAMIGISVIALSLPVILISIYQMVDQGETQYTQLEVNRAENTLQKEMEGLNQVVMDWASWDETYAYAKDRDPIYIENNLSQSVISNLDIDVFLILNQSKQVMFARYFNNGLELPERLPFSVSNLLQTYPLLINDANLQSGMNGMVVVDDQPMLVAAHPILTSQAKGPSVGVLIFFRFLNAREFAKIEQLTLRKISVFPAADLPAGLPSLPVPMDTKDKKFVLVQNTETGTGYHYLFDLNRQPTLVLKVENPRILFAQGKITALVFSGMILLLASLLSIGAYRFSRSFQETRRAGRRYLERFQALVQQSSEAILLVSGGGHILDANIAAMNLLKLLPDPAHPARLGDLLTFEKALDEDFLRAAVRNNQVIEQHCIRHDGQPLHMELSVSQISAQETHAYSIILRNITARIQAEQAMRENEELFRTTFENATTGVCLVDMKGKFIRINGKLSKILGYPQAELLRLTFNEIAYSEDREIGMNFLKQMQAGAIDHATFEKRYVSKAGNIIWTLVSTGVVRSSHRGSDYFVTHIQDITERKQLEEKLRHDSLHDPLTGLGNRNLLIEHLTLVNERKKRIPDLLFALFFVDFDRFKMINDSLGHYAGDQLLIEASRRLAQGLRSTDRIARFTQPETLVRIAGDEFVILLEDFQSVEDIHRVADRVEWLLSSLYHIGGIEVNLTASIGLVIPDQPYNDPEDIIRDADIAMYRAKLSGGAKAVCFNPEMHANAMARIQMEGELRQAVDQGEFVVYYQPIYAFNNDPLAGNPVSGFEALVRWNSPRRGLLMPADFIPMAEETSLIVPICYFVLEEACRQMQLWRQTNCISQDVVISVNLSSRQIMNGDLVKRIHTILEETGFDPKRLWLEVTESTLIQISASVWTQLNELRKMGICIEIDDFGTGYSSLSYLQHLPIDGIKIDRSFISEIQDSSSEGGSASGTGSGHQIVKTLIDLSHCLGLTTVAEGVETESQRDYLVSLDCDYAQGFLMSQPVSAAEMEQYLNR